MSVLNKILVTFSAIIVLTPCFFYSPYLTLTFILLSVLVYLYIDYENSLTQGAPANTTARFVSNCFKDFHLQWIIPNSLRKYRLSNPFTKAYYQSLNMPSISSQEKIRRPVRANGGYVVSPNLNLSENRITSPATTTRATSCNDRHRPHFPLLNGDSFNALSPITSDGYRNNSPSTYNTRLKNIKISDSGKQTQHSSIHLDSHNTSYTLNSSRNSSSSMKHSTPGSMTRNVHSFSGLLSTSTRYNLSSDSVLFADVNSPGLFSRVAQYSHSSSSSSPAVTHQSQYSSPGQFPLVYLGKTTKLPVLSARNSSKLSQAPVRVRMAPLESEERRSYALSDRSQILSDFSQTSPVPPKSVLDTLHEISRKRLHAQLGDYESESGKKQRTNENSETPKREREETQLDEDTSLKKRTRNNEISSSLSSSLRLLDRPNKRKTSVEDDGNDVNATKPAGKVAKKSVMNQVALPISADIILADEDEVMTEPSPMSEPKDVQMASPAAADQGDTTPEFVHKEFSPRAGNVVLDQLSTHRIISTKSRLLDMMSTLGTRDKDVDLLPPKSAETAFSSLSVPSTVSQPTASALPPMFQTSDTKVLKKHVHFDDNLQIKTFDTVEATNSMLEARSSVETAEANVAPGPEEDTVTNFAAVVSAKPSTGFFSPVTSIASVGSLTTMSNTAPISSPVILGQPEQKSPLSFGNATTSAISFGQGSTSNSLTTTFGSGGATFSTPATTASAFGPSVTPSITTFGSPATTLPLFGSPATSVATFGSAATSIPTFGTPATNLTATTTAAPVTLSQTFTLPVTTATFGSATTTLPSFRAAASPALTFGSPATSGSTAAVPMFGSTTTPAPALNPTLTLATATTTAVPTFGSTTSGPTFGSSTLPTFGMTSSSFASPTPAVFGTPATSVPVFGAASSTFGTAVATSTGFGSATSSFGNAAPPPYPGSKPRDGDANSVSGSKPSLFAFGAQTQASTFGNTATSTFAGFSTPSQTGFGVKQSFSFTAPNASAPTEPGSVFGGKPNTGSSSPFQFNASNTMSSSTAMDGQPKAGGFKFDLSQAKPTVPSGFGMFSTNQPTGTNSSATTTNQGGFSFNTATPKPFGATFGNADSTTNPMQSSQSGFETSTFGPSSQQIAQKPAVFGFGATQPASSTFSFNAASSAPKVPTGFGFPQAPTQGFGQSQPVANAFGQVQPAANAFQFGAPAAVNPGGGFNFGSAAGAPVPNFGGGAPNAGFQMGGPPQFGGAQGPGGAGMFSIGTGSSGTRGRTGMRPRARRT